MLKLLSRYMAWRASNITHANSAMRYQGGWIGAAISVGGALLGGALGDDAAQGAAGDANAGIQAGIDEISKVGDRTRKDTAAYRALGGGSANTLSYLLGITDGAPKTREQIYQELLPDYTLESMGIVDPNNTNGIADTLLNKAVDEEMQYNIGANKNAGEQGSLLKKFAQSDLNNDLVYQNGLQFGLNEGNKAIENRARALGGSDSGSVLKALTRFGNDYGTTKTEGAYNRFNTDKLNTYNMLMGGTGVGQSAVNTDANTGSQLAAALSNGNAAMGANNAAGRIGSANYWSDAIGSSTNTLGRLLRVDPSKVSAGANTGVSTGIDFSGYNNPITF